MRVDRFGMPENEKPDSNVGLFIFTEPVSTGTLSSCSLKMIR